MPRIKHYVQLVILDILAVLCILLAIATGWLPGPGGIPLFLIGLSLLAVNHEWAERYIDLMKEYADKVSDLIFLPRLQVFFDIVSPLLLTIGIVLVLIQTQLWMLSLGVFGLGMSLVTFFGNRNRWARFKKFLRKSISSNKT